MFEKLELTRMAQGLAAHAGARIGLIAQNIANADTPRFRGTDLPAFADVYDTGEPVERTRAEPLNSAVDPNGNNVTLDDQMRRMVEVRQSHEMALAIYRSTSGIIRLALGRGGQ